MREREGAEETYFAKSVDKTYQLNLRTQAFQNPVGSFCLFLQKTKRGGITHHTHREGEEMKLFLAAKSAPHSLQFCFPLLHPPSPLRCRQISPQRNDSPSPRGPPHPSQRQREKG